jgi:GYD domain-containing protein
MPLYQVEYSYTPDAWDALLANSVERDRQRAVEGVVEALGGRFPRLVFDGEPKLPDVRCKRFAFGEHDVIALIYFPDNEAAAAFAMLISATGAVKSFKTTLLLTMEEGIRAMERAEAAKKKATTYAPPLRPNTSPKAGP